MQDCASQEESPQPDHEVKAKRRSSKKKSVRGFLNDGGFGSA